MLLAFFERPAQTREGASPYASESDLQQRVGELERPLEREIGVIDDSCAPVGRLEGDPVQRDDG